MARGNSLQSSRHPARRAQRNKSLEFGRVEVIPDVACNSAHSSPSCVQPVAPPSSLVGYKLRRSPTPVLTSLSDLAHAHLSQLSTVWQETCVPSLEQDKRDIAASRDDKDDPFDF
ncbi:hypothetical protein BWQ96_10069 [Gracilariopsis chorda]|uniref:Uncharacterized protein n=1 Tax=Gracilariopsis chorda TaxID=448386 RepID=A0A2V3IDV8_9FLOR|nr:hypothetical protein BWQ96_10069 [Gracilariopsis chorda]|eukprot:PXF40231.1 hypothetical protein BWQ96_10069 [Gracilariopsis chorda]